MEMLPGVGLFVLLLVVLLVVVFLVPPVRKQILSRPILVVIRALKLLPPISATEQEALDAGNTWVDGALFSGKPDVQKIMKEAYPKLTKEEQEFIDGPCEELCAAVNSWDVHLRGDLTPETWALIKKHKIFGLIVPKKYGGLGFSPLANSAMVAKLASRCYPLAITAMVPNSLGPAELLHLYGTEEQKNFYLPRLASGDEIPCFGLTEPEAGSDAGSIQSEGILFRGENNEIMVRLNWRKRYITLGSVATLIGLAIKLRDPENILGKGTELGITTILVPANLPGISLGKRHDPLTVNFINSEIEGKDVVVAAEKQIIGGLVNAGKGWKMLMGCLAAGRGISLPATAAGSAKYLARVVGGYAAVRKQFALNIGIFEGIQEPLARIGGKSYLLEAVRTFTCGALNDGKTSSVISAIAKAYCTEIHRQSIADGMDILGGSAISLGPKNLIAGQHLSSPIAITVEGANILTRSMIIFGNGVFRCHPYIYKEMKSILDNNLEAFDWAFWRHVVFALTNLVRVPVLSLSHGWLSPCGWGFDSMAKYRRKLLRASAAFTLHTEIFLATYTGSLKTREMLTGRMADVLANMYFALAVMRRFEAQGRAKEFQPFAVWALEHCFNEIQKANEQTARNIDTPILGHFFRWVVLPWTRIMSVGAPPSDKLGRVLAKALQTPGAVRDEICCGIFVPSNRAEPLSELESAMNLALATKASQLKIRKAITQKKIAKGKEEDVLAQALAAGILTEAEAKTHREARRLAKSVVEVDVFEAKDFVQRKLANTQPLV